jgi:hypothetical protein
MKYFQFLFAILVSITGYSQEYISNEFYSGKYINHVWEFSKSTEVNSTISITNNAVYIDNSKQVTLTSEQEYRKYDTTTVSQWNFLDSNEIRGSMVMTTYPSGKTTLTFHYLHRLFAYYIKPNLNIELEN